MLKSNRELSSSLKKPSSANSNIKKKLTFNLVDQLSENEENDSGHESVRLYRHEYEKGSFEQKVADIKEKYSPMVEFNSGIYLDYYTCKEFNKKV
jgi:hypothetical protein